MKTENLSRNFLVDHPVALLGLAVVLLAGLPARGQTNEQVVEDLRERLGQRGPTSIETHLEPVESE